MKFKYVMFEDGNFVIIPISMGHDEIRKLGRNIISAGFIGLSDENLSVWGNSISLKLKSNLVDGEIISRRGNQF